MFSCQNCCAPDEVSIVNVDTSVIEGSKVEGCVPAPEAENKPREEGDALKGLEEDKGLQLQPENECKDNEEQKQGREEEQAASEMQRGEDQEPPRPQREEEDKAEPLRQEEEGEQATAPQPAPQPTPYPALLLDGQQQPAAEEKAKEEELPTQLTDWLKKNGFAADVNAKKKTRLPPSHCYPLHTAVKEKNAQMVRTLVQFGADKNMPNSSGLKALELANKSNKKNSHDEIIAALN